MEDFEIATRLLPEQVWDPPDLPSAAGFLRAPHRRGDAADVGARGVHRLLRCGCDERQGIRFHPAGRGALLSGPKRKRIELWKDNRQPRKSVRAGSLLASSSEGCVSCCIGRRDEWRTVEGYCLDDDAARFHPRRHRRRMGSHGADSLHLPMAADPERWEGRD